MHRHSAVLLVLALFCASQAGCFDPKVPPAGVLCGAQGECPDGNRCEETTATCVPESWAPVAELRFDPWSAPFEAEGDAQGATVRLLDASGALVPVSGGDFKLALDPATPTDVQLTAGKRAKALNGVVIFSGVTLDRPGRRLRLLASTDARSGTSDYVDVTPTRPQVKAIVPVTEAEGCSAVTYVVAQQQSLPVDVLVEVDPDGPGPAPYRHATQGASPAGTPGVQGVSTNPGGKSQTFTWNTSADLPLMNAQATLRFTPRVAGVSGAAMISEPMQVQNGLRWDNLSTLDQSRWLVIGDLDRDGWPDRVLGEDNNLAIDYGRGTPQYVQVNLGFAAKDAAIGDFNHDGRRDLAVATDGGRVQVLLQSSSSPRQLVVSGAIAVPERVRQVVAVDLDRDGRDDLLSVDDASGAVSLLLQKPGQSPFTNEPVWPGSSDSTRIAVGDVNDDGWPDVVVGRTAAKVVVILSDAGKLGDPAGDPGVSGGAVAVSDLDHDGKHEIVALGASGLALVELSGSAPASPTVVQLPGITGSSFALGDVDGDGRTDLVTTDPQRGVEAHLHVADRSALAFVAPDQLYQRPVAFLAVTDLDRDGRGDVVTSGSGINRTEYTNVTPRRCDTGLVGLRGQVVGPTLAQIVDFNADGKLDLVVHDSLGHVIGTRGLGNGELGQKIVGFDDGTQVTQLLADLDDHGVLAGLVTDGVTAEITLRLPAFGGADEPTLRHVAADVVPQAVAVSDVDRDGRQDLLAMGSDEIVVMLADPLHPGSYRAPAHLPTPVEASATTCTDSAPCRLFAADLDRDGWPEIVAQSGTHLRVFRPDRTSGGFQPAQALELEMLSLLAIGDVVGDEALEILVESGDVESRIDAYQLAADGSLASVWNAPVPQNGTQAVITDVDLDGKNEIVLSGVRGRTVIFSAASVAAGSELPRDRGVFASGSLAVADLDADGRPDLAVCDHQSCLVATAPTLAETMAGSDPLAAIGRVGGALAVGDMTGDGLLDIASSAAGGGAGLSLARQRPEQPGQFEAATMDLPTAGMIELADLNRDGWADVLAVDGDSQRVYVNQAGATLAPGVCSIAGTPARLAVADLDGDTRADLVSWSEEVRVVRSRLDECVASQPILSLVDPATGYWQKPSLATLADMNNDGWLDVVTVSDRVWIALQVPGAPGTFRTADAYDATAIAGGAVADIDRDGWLDVVLAVDAGVWMMRGDPGKPGKLDSTLAPLINSFIDPPESLLLGDLDGNGLVDLLVSTQTHGSRVYLGAVDEEGVYFAQAYNTVSSERGSFDLVSGYLVDVDADGRDDLLVADGQRGSVLVRGH